jgi:excisionase family DNA binding protein
MSALPEMPHVLTVEEVARLLRVGRSAAYAAARSGELPTIRIGRAIRVPRHRLAQLLGEEEDLGPPNLRPEVAVQAVTERETNGRPAA